jgi:hypothetical protein
MGTIECHRLFGEEVVISCPVEHDAQMNLLRKGLADSGLNPTEDPNRDFFVGRNPLDETSFPGQ